VLAIAPSQSQIFTEIDFTSEDVFGEGAEHRTRGACAPQRSANATKRYSPTLRFRLAREYSRLSFAIKLALISAGQTASHS
jgi:hypothetical protein